MITKDNLRELLLSLEFVKDTTNINDVMTRRFSESETQISVDFSIGQIIYPKELKIERATTINFSDNENFVVLECVCQLLKIGYYPSNIVLEPKTPGGREDGNYYGDILITDNEGIPFILIECKTTGEDKDEYSKEWHKMLLDGGQLFRYYNSYRQAQYICLYTADFVNGISQSSYRMIKMTDNEERISADKDLISYSSVTSNGGDYREYFNVWKVTYEFDYLTRGAFEQKFSVRENAYDANRDLREIDSEEIKKKYNEFAVILRQHNIGSHENAFDKLVNLFLAKVVDETNNPNDLHFYWKGTSYDDDFSLQDRLQRLYRDGMKKFLGEDVTYIENSEIDKAFRWVVNDLDATKKTIKEYFRALKFFSDNDFAFISVHNERLFKQNAIVLRKIVKMLQDIRLRTSENYQNQLLGDLFEGFLNKGVKQSEGQFFTPMPIVRFIVSSLPLEYIIKNSPEPPLAIDYACGAGHFLTEYAFRIKEYVEKYYGNNRLKDYYANIYGIEKEYRLSKVSKVSAFMYGHDDTNIIYADALEKINELKDGTFSVLVANPPYSVSGFLETLSEKQRKSYSIFNDDINIDKNNAIETFFIERAAQLLKSGGVAGIVLPVSVLSKDGIYTRAREIILKFFDIISIVKFDKGTFGKTSTNTITLFLRRKETTTPDSEHYNSRVNDWFNNNNKSDIIYQDTELIEAYCAHMRYDYNAYIEFLNGKILDSLAHNEMFEEYSYAFFGNSRNAMKGVTERAKNIRNRFKNQEKTATYKSKSKEEQNQIAQDAFALFAKDIEKSKIYYFILGYTSNSPVLLVNMPSGTVEGKNFLGYEWSDSNGREGIKYLHTDIAESDESGDSILKQIRGINGIVTPLFNPSNLLDETRINTLIRNNYLGEDITIPDDISEYVKLVPLNNLIDYHLVGISKEIKTMPIAEYPIFHSKYETKKLGQIAPFVTERQSLNLQNVRKYVSTDNMLPNKGGIKWESGINYAINAGIRYKADDILVSNIRPYLKKIWLADCDGICSPDVLVFRINEKDILSKYLFELLSCDLFFDYMMAGNTGLKMPRGDKNSIRKFQVPIPPIKIQERIIEECSKATSQEKQTILNKYFN